MQPDRDCCSHKYKVYFFMRRLIYSWSRLLLLLTVEVIELRSRGECPRLIHVQQQENKKVEVNQKLMVAFFILIYISEYDMSVNLPGSIS